NPVLRRARAGDGTRWPARLLLLGRPGDTDLGAPGPAPRGARQPRFLGFCGISDRRRNGRSCPQGGPRIIWQSKDVRGAVAPARTSFLREGVARAGIEPATPRFSAVCSTN